MKPMFKLRSFLAGSAFFATVIGNAHAQTQYYYDNLAGAGFGSAGATWGTNNVISTDPTGTAAAGNPVTTTADTLNLGTSTVGLGGGNISVVGTGRSIGSIVRGSASGSDIIQIQGSTITFANEGFVTNNATGQTLTISSVIAGGGTSMTFTNVNLNNASNSYAGATILVGNGNRVSSIGNGGGNSAFGSSSSAASNLVFEDGASLRYDGGNASTNRNFTINGSSATIYSRASAGTNLTWNGTASFGTADQDATLILLSNIGSGIFNGLLADNGAGQLSIEKALATSWTLNAANTFTGSTTITSGLLILGNANALQNSYIDTASSAPGDATNGLRTTGAALNLGGLSGDKDLSSIYTTATGGYGSVTGITLNVAAANDLSYSGAIGGGRTLTKTGAGTQTLSGTYTYSGATNVNEGTLLINGSISTSIVTVDNGATLGGNNGTIGGATTVNGTLAPGSSVGNLNFTDSLTLGATSTYLFELNNTTNAADLTNVTGILDISNGAILDLVQLGAFQLGDKFTLFSYSDTLTGNFSGLTEGAMFSDAGGTWQIAYADDMAGLNGGSGTSFVTITAVIPEPSAALLGTLGLLALLRRRRA